MCVGGEGEVRGGMVVEGRVLRVGMLSLRMV